jgi:hypothetical protein
MLAQKACDLVSRKRRKLGRQDIIRMPVGLFHFSCSLIAVSELAASSVDKRRRWLFDAPITSIEEMK